MTHTSKYFYGNKISDEGLRNNRVDYATFAKAFDAVLNNNIIEALNKAGYYFDEENTTEYYDNDGNYYTSEEAEEKREELQEELDKLREELDVIAEAREEADTPEAAPATLESLDNRIEELENAIEELENNIETLEEDHYKDLFQYYIVSDNALDLLREAGEAIFICEDLDLIVWGVDHWGTSWDYVMTSIRLNLDEE